MLRPWSDAGALAANHLERRSPVQQPRPARWRASATGPRLGPTPTPGGWAQAAKSESVPAAQIRVCDSVPDCAAGTDSDSNVLTK